MRHTISLYRYVIVFLSALLVLAALALPVFAAGTTTKETCVTQYGGATECKKETISEEVVHPTTIETKPAGLADDLNLIGSIAVIGGGVLFALSKLTRRVYVLD